jgi:predicted nucleic acid-binding protein
VSWLLDINVLLALAYEAHADHARVIRWFASLIGSDSRVATCAITEVGFVRVSMQAGFENTAPEAAETLRGLKASSPISVQLIPDSLGADRLPSYIVGARQVTDGHLLELAQESSMHLATLDRGIPGAFVIPEDRAGG